MRGQQAVCEGKDRLTVMKRFSVLIAAILCILIPAAGNGRGMFSFGSQALAAQAGASGGLVWKEQKGYYCCYQNGKKLKGLQKAGNRTWYFDSKGRQRTGWRKIGNRYCYFTVKNGEAGCLVTGKKVNGIRIDKSGTAQAGGNGKLALLVRYQELADRLVKPADDEESKLKRIFLYARKSRYGVTPDPGYSGRWDEKLAASFINMGYGDCLGKAAGFAYLANALGYRKVTIVRNGHAFVTFGKRIYEVSLAAPKGSDDMDYFGRKYSAGIVSWHAAQIRKKMPSRVI